MASHAKIFSCFVPSAPDFPTARIDIVAHSFGTHLVGWSLMRSYRATPLRVGTVILSGSVLKSRFPWDRLIHAAIVERVINECGSTDWILVLNQAFVLFTGMAGRLWFTGALDDRLVNNWHAFGHSGFFVLDAKSTMILWRTGGYLCWSIIASQEKLTHGEMDHGKVY
jgi:hypothetical protein